MNKTQFYTLSGALLASTALSGAANAGTIGRFDSQVFTTSGITVANSLFSTTASTANTVVLGGSTAAGRNFGMRYTNNFSGTTRWTTEFTLTGARFVTGGLTTANVVIFTATASNLTTVSGEASGTVACASVTSLVDLLVVNDCAISTGMGQTGLAYGIGLTGVTFNSASGLATAGSTVTLTGRVYNPSNVSQTFEASASGTMLTSAAPIQVISAAGTSVTASATTTPLAFTALSLPTNGSLSVTLATIRLSATGATDAGLSAQTNSIVSTNLANTTAITVASTILTSASVRSVSLVAQAGGISNTTVANFSSGSVTFTIGTTTWAATSSAAVVVQFQGTTAIPAAAAGTITSSVQASEAALTASSATASVSQGGFRAEVNTFNASTNAPFSSYLRIHNNGAVAGVVTITVNNDDHTVGNATLGAAFSTASILPGTTMQLSAAEMEGTTTSTKLPAGGANIPTASRVGSYTLNITGPIVGYVQHILFDGKSVADLSGYRNSGNTSNTP